MEKFIALGTTVWGYIGVTKTCLEVSIGILFINSHRQSKGCLTAPGNQNEWNPVMMAVYEVPSKAVAGISKV